MKPAKPLCNPLLGCCIYYNCCPAVEPSASIVNASKSVWLNSHRICFLHDILTWVFNRPASFSLLPLLFYAPNFGPRHRHLRPKRSVVLIDLLWKIGSNMCGKGNGSHVCPSTATAAAAATGRQRSQFSDFVFQCKVRAAVSTEHFEHFLSQDRLFYQTTTPHRHF